MARQRPGPTTARGGRSAALAALGRVDPVAYGRTRNHLDGAVTRLSPYLRHGVLTLAQVRRAALASWQWVASTWRRAPYIWNRASLVDNGGDRCCSRCPLRDSGCPFDTSSALLTERLFPAGPAAVGPDAELREALRSVNGGGAADQPPTSQPVLVWVHGERLSPTNEALTAYVDAPAVFVWDEELWQRNRCAPSRATFIAECLEEMPVMQERGDVAEILSARARMAGASMIATTASPSPQFSDIVSGLRDSGSKVLVHAPEPFVTAPERLDLPRRASYWHAVKKSSLSQDATPGGSGR